MKNQSLLIVDDEVNVIKSLKRLLLNEDYTIYSANSGAEGLELLENNVIGVVMSDQRMPEMDGITFLESVRQRYPYTVRIILTAHASLDSAIAAIRHARLYDYLIKPWSENVLLNTLAKAFEYHNLIVDKKRLEQKVHEQNDELKHINTNLEAMVSQRTEQLQEAVEEGILMLATAAEANDDDTGDHVKRIQSLTQAICIELGMTSAKAEEIGFFSMMHDVGKIHTPDSILKKPGSLDAEEWKIMKDHSAAGELILGNKPFYKIAREIARSHHERWDGKGYPDGLKGDAIPLPARIVNVADVFDALTHKRVYKPAWPVAQALDEMRKMSGENFDPDVANAFFALIDTGKFKVSE
ncbi:response regulator [Desulfococcaceae bacterium HSG9]|nr:response regulator [Desulfococcaceae bacterium HSG9]